MKTVAKPAPPAETAATAVLDPMSDESLDTLMHAVVQQTTDFEAALLSPAQPGDEDADDDADGPALEDDAGEVGDLAVTAPDEADDDLLQEPDMAYLSRRYPWADNFFKALRNSGNVRIATRLANITRQRAYQVRQEDPHFAAAWEMALDEATDTLEMMARARAMSQSDTLMIFLLKANRPEKYADSSRIELTTKIDVTKLSEAQLVKVINAGGKVPPGSL